MTVSARPNIVWFICDDTGFNMLGYTGGPVLTPTIDRIAREGVACSQFHTAAASCTPSRYAYLTGLYPSRCRASRYLALNPPGVPANASVGVQIQPGDITLGSLLQDAGYVTGHVGKWHVGSPRAAFHGDYHRDDNLDDPDVARKLREDYAAMQAEVRNAGFDYAEALAWGDTDSRPLAALRYHNLEWHTDAALRFLAERNRDTRPFFLSMALTTIHGPHHIESLESDGRQVEWGYLDAMPRVQAPRATVLSRLDAAPGVAINHQTVGALWMDDAIAAVMARLDAMGVADNTIVIWSTDHGPGTIDSKMSCYHGGVHIPLCMRWPGRIPAGSTCDALSQNIDFVPTLLAAAGIAPPPGVAFDGIDRWDQLCGAAPDRRDDLYFELGRTRAVRTRRWKYLAFRYTPEEINAMRSGAVPMAFNMFARPGGDFVIHQHSHYFEPDQLYDLEHDPTEQHNLAGSPAHAGVMRDMQERLRCYCARFDHPFDLAVDPFVFTDRFRELARATTADDRCYQADWYLKHAY
jgi:arylsulfatase A-like enzyme